MHDIELTPLPAEPPTPPCSARNVRRTGRESHKRDFACALAPDNLRLQLVRSFGIHLTDRQFAALFRVMDINGDG